MSFSDQQTNLIEDRLNKNLVITYHGYVDKMLAYKGTRLGERHPGGGGDNGNGIAGSVLRRARLTLSG